MQSKPKKWTISEGIYDDIKSLIFSYDATEDDTSKNSSEVWRLRIGKSVFTLYTSGTLYNNQATSGEVLELREKISQFSSSNFKNTEKELKIGLDETGKGEVIGHAVLCGVIYPNHLSEDLEDVVGVADTKSRKSFEYWDALFAEIVKLKDKGLDFITQTIPPWHIDKYHINKIMDIVYKRIISDISRGIPLERTSLVIDDYQIDDNLDSYLKSLKKSGISVYKEEKADDQFLEAKIASIIAKREREKIIRGINERFKIKGIYVGSGNVADPKTVAWLTEWKKSGKDWPWFVKKSFSTIRKVDGKTGKVIKIDPPIKHELISSESKNILNDGQISSSSLTISCPNCGSNSKAIKITPNETRYLQGRCINCSSVIDDISTTLLYYNGCLVPDTSAILSGILSKDLDRGKFFENFTILLHPRVSDECDNPGGKAELGRISDIANTGRIRLTKLIDFMNYETKADDEIVESAKKKNAIILTKDMGQYASASGLDVFTITSK